MRKLSLAFGFIVLLCAQTFAQAQAQQLTVLPCTLPVAQSPAIRDVRLGMSALELFSLFPGSADKEEIKSALSTVDGYPHFGLAEIYIRPDEYLTKDRFTGISLYYFVLFDGQLVRFQVYYSEPPVAPRWSQVDDFVSSLAQAFQLPLVAQWPTSTERTGKSLKCTGFQMEAEVIDAKGSLIVSIPDFDKKQKERGAAYEGQMRRAFKP